MADTRSGGDDWDEDDFHTLLANAQCSNDYLAALLADHSTSAIIIVRQGVCDFHKGRPNILLSEMMLRELRTKKGRRACFVCGELY
jgi:hypothetical protein